MLSFLAKLHTYLVWGLSQSNTITYLPPSPISSLNSLFICVPNFVTSEVSKQLLHFLWYIQYSTHCTCLQESVWVLMYYYVVTGGICLILSESKWGIWSALILHHLLFSTSFSPNIFTLLLSTDCRSTIWFFLFCFMQHFAIINKWWNFNMIVTIPYEVW